MSLIYFNKLFFKGAGAYICGSSNNGFGTEDSDIDICLMVSLKEVIAFFMDFFLLFMLYRFKCI